MNARTALYNCGRHTIRVEWTHDADTMLWSAKNLRSQIGPAGAPPSGIECPLCNCFARGNAVKGKVSSRKCDVRCTSARGFTCNCQCGGQNHGADHAIGT